MRCRLGQSFFATIWRRVCCIAGLLSLVPLLGISSDPAAGQSAIPKLIFSPWTKFCPAGPDASGKPACRTARFGRTEAGPPIVAAILTEPEVGAQEILHVVLPIGMQVPQGARLIVDAGQPLNAPYAACFSKGCVADFETSAELIGKLQGGRTLMVQGIDSRGDQKSLDLPLEDFAKAYGGPPSTDAKLVHQLQDQLPERGSQASGELEQQLREGSHLRYSPWTKFCLKKDGQANCFTGKDGRFGSGPAMVAAVLIEPEGGARKVFRVTLPIGMQMPQGTRVFVDHGQPLTAPYVVCFDSGCMADYEASDDLIGRLKVGQLLTVQGINSQGQAVSPILPLAEFAKAHDGPPMDPKKFEEKQKELQEQLKKGAEDQRRNSR
jgi:invasion protein IalB